ncbi:MAG: group 1 glycosyl transferase [Candidatus Peribacteria bacterium]|nr:group 1 glycosyl transferase [Candidatus Peribacteria bacterium]
MIWPVQAAQGIYKSKPFALPARFVSFVSIVKTILLISPYWKEQHRWMVSSFKLAELWQRLGYRLIVVCMGAETGIEEVSPSLVIHRRKDFFLPDPWNYGISFGFSGYVMKLVHAERPQEIVINKLLFWTSFAALRLRLAGYQPIVLTDALVGMTWFPRSRLPALAARLYAWTGGWLILLAARRVVFFHPQPDSLLQFLRIAHKTEVIPTGIDETGYGHTALAQSQGDHAVTVTYVGRLESVKGVDDFLAAILPLKRKYAQLRAQVVGWYKEDHPLVKQYERDIIFTGLRHDIPDILACTDIFVLPSHSEGLSNALMEAMASGCACIASDVGGNRFLIQNGVSGFLFPAGDREALAAHMQRLLEDPAKCRAMGTAARQRIEKEFSWNVVGKRYETLFHNT